jgi:hypothetical protein
MKPRTRQMLIYGGLLATVLAAVLAPPPDDSAPQPVTATSAAGEAVESRAAASSPDRAPVTVALRPQPRKALQGDPRDLFHIARPPQAVAAPVAGQTAATAPPPRPVAPPLPYTYMGRITEQGQLSVFLTRNGKPYVARPGAVLDGQYRVDAIEPPLLEFTYLPLAQKQTLNIGTTR